MTNPPSGDPSALLVAGPWRHRDLTANGVRLHVVEQGEGPLVVLLHGFPEFWWMWRHQIPALAGAGYRVVAPDLRGYGGSDKPPRGYDLFTASADIAGLIRVLGEREAVIIGHDWGGLVAWTTAALHAGLVRGLGSVSSPHPRRLRREFVVSRRQRSAMGFAFGYQVPRRPERRLTEDGAVEVERLMRAWSGPVWSGTDDFATAVHRYRSAMRVPQAAYGALEYYRWALRSMLRSDGARYARAMAVPLEVPVVQLHGGADPLILTSTAAGSAAYAAGSYDWHTYAGLGHFLPEEAPAEVTATLLDWLARLP